MSGAGGDPFLDDQLPLHPGDAVAALLLSPDGRYLLQRRDRKAGIFFPDHWGCFGGGVDAYDADRKAALRRELREELELDVPTEAMLYFTDYTFDFSFCGLGVIYRTYFEVKLKADQIPGLSLSEGTTFGMFTAREVLAELKLTPYDTLALWMHANRRRLSPAPRTD